MRRPTDIEQMQLDAEYHRARMEGALDQGHYESAYFHSLIAESNAKEAMYAADDRNDPYLFTNMNHSMWFYRDLQKKLDHFQKRQKPSLLDRLLGRV